MGFLIAVGAGIVIYALAGLLPIIGAPVGWIALVLAGFLIGREAASSPKVSNPVGYGLGMGFLAGTLVRAVGSFFQAVVSTAVVSSGASTETVDATAGVFALGFIGAMLSAPIIGGGLGAIGGLIGGSLGGRKSA